jgi:hypothetical protein
MIGIDVLEKRTGRRAAHAPRVALIVLMLTCGLGCEDESIAGRPAGGSGEPGASVAIKGQRVEAGFALGHMRKSVELASFRISKHPVTLGEFRTCVNAGSCETPRAMACVAPLGKKNPQNFHDQSATDEFAATCVGVKGARQYCTWVGGKLPTFEQWLLAARGPSPQRYPWGTKEATCEQHPLGVLTRPGACLGLAKSALSIGQRSAGASPLGVHDLLLAGAELLDTSEDAMFTACKKAKSAPGIDRACVVYGLQPGAIDSVMEIRADSQRSEFAPGYGFRCVWGGAS